MPTTADVKGFARGEGDPDRERANKCATLLLHEVWPARGDGPGEQFSLHPQWVILLILVNLLICIIVALALTKRRRVWTPLCPDHAGYWAIRAWFLNGGLLAVLGSLVGLIFVTASRRGPDAGLGRPVLHLVLGGVFLLWLFAVAILNAMSIRPEKITDTRIGLLGVHADFAAALDRQRDAAAHEYARRGGYLPGPDGRFDTHHVGRGEAARWRRSCWANASASRAACPCIA